MKTSKFKLEELKLDSFITELNLENEKTINGGAQRENPNQVSFPANPTVLSAVQSVSVGGTSVISHVPNDIA